MARSVTLLHFKVRKAWFIEQESGVNEVRTSNIVHWKHYQLASWYKYRLMIDTIAYHKNYTLTIIMYVCDVAIRCVLTREYYCVVICGHSERMCIVGSYR